MTIVGWLEMLIWESGQRGMVPESLVISDDAARQLTNELGHLALYPSPGCDPDLHQSLRKGEVTYLGCRLRVAP